MAAEWELIILSALRQRGIVQAEATMPGLAKPDFIFQMEGEGSGRNILGDVTCLSDAGYEAHNLVDDPLEELLQRFREKGVHGSVFVHINYLEQELYEKSKIRLALPAEGIREK